MGPLFGGRWSTALHRGFPQELSADRACIYAQAAQQTYCMRAENCAPLNAVLGGLNLFRDYENFALQL